MKIVFLNCLCLSILLASCRGGVEPKAAPIKPVKVGVVEDLSVVEKSYTGVVASSQTSTLAFKMGGLVQKSYIERGQHVKAGQVLMELDPQDIILDNEAKKANYVTQNESLKRAERLLSKNAIAQQEYESTVATYQNAKTAYETSNRNVQDTKLRAPFSGFIMETYADEYNRVQAGEKVLDLVNPKDLEIKFTVPESNGSYLSAVNETFVEFDTYKGTFFKCKLKDLVTASADGAGIPVVVKIDDPAFDLSQFRVAVGYSCRLLVKIQHAALNGVYSVPISALIPDELTKTTSVFVYNDKSSTVKKVPVIYDSTLLGSGRVAIKGDISNGDKVVIAGATRLDNGQVVKVILENN